MDMRLKEFEPVRESDLIFKLFHGAVGDLEKAQTLCL